MVICFIEYYKNVCFISFFMVMLGWLRNSLAAVFCWCVNNVGCFLLYLFLMASALRRSRSSWPVHSVGGPVTPNTHTHTHNSVGEFMYTSDEELTFAAYFRRYEAVFQEDLRYIVFCSGNSVKANTKSMLTISSSSSWRAASTDIPEPLSPRLSIIHRLRQVFEVTSRIIT